MLLTLLALAGVLIALEEFFSRLVRPTWRAVRWFMLPLGALIVVHYVPATLFGYPTVMDTWTSALLALAAATIIGVHGTFRDGHWIAEDPKAAHRHVPPHIEHRPRSVRPSPATKTTPSPMTARAPLRSRP